MLRKRGWLEGLVGKAGTRPRRTAGNHTAKCQNAMLLCVMAMLSPCSESSQAYFSRQLATVMNTLSFLPCSRKVTV